MENVKELLQKLDRFAVVSNAGNSKTRIHLENGLEVSYGIKANLMYGNLFQIDVCVKKDGVFGTSWGCMEMDENRAVLEWFIKKEADAYKMDSAERKKAEQDVKRLLA